MESCSHSIGLEKAKAMKVLKDFTKNKKIALFGFGRTGRQIYDIIKSDVELIIDDSLSLEGQKQYQGIRIISKEQFTADSDRQNYLVIICIFKPFVSIKSIAKKFQHYNVETLPFYSLYKVEGLKNMLSDNLFFSQKHSIEDLDVKGVLVDQLSRKVYTEFNKLKKEFGISKIPYSSREVVSEFIDFANHGITFIDCGAYDGDTIRDFVKSSADEFRKVIGIEPDRKNFAALKAYVKNNFFDEARFELINKAIWFNNEGIYFSEMETMESKITLDNTATKVESITIEELVTQNAISGPVLVKLDLEGFEESILEECIDKIINQNVSFIVSAYHTPVELNNLIKIFSKYATGFNFYLRCHGFNGEDLNLYAIQKKISFN